jgi:CheY-like chemotaxis protein
MIVDDDPDILLSVQQILEASGYKVYTFENGLECIKKLNEGKKPSLIILDVMMPLMSGWEIHRVLGEHPRWKRIPVVFLTGRINDTAKEMYKRYSIEHIKKPFNIKEFKEKIEEILDEREKYAKKMRVCHLCS